MLLVLCALPNSPILKLSQGAVGAWLSKPLRVAWKSQQSADHPTEMYFLKADGCGLPPPPPPCPTSDVELCVCVRVCVSPRRQTQGTFASLYDAPSKYLTLVVPAYNEEKRMGVMLDEMLGVLETLEKQRRCVSPSPFPFPSPHVVPYWCAGVSRGRSSL